MAFGDAEGAIQMLTAADEGAMLPLNGFEGTPVEWADPPEPYLDIDWTDTTCVDGSYSLLGNLNFTLSYRPLNSVGMPYYNESTHYFTVHNNAFNAMIRRSSSY